MSKAFDSIQRNTLIEDLKNVLNQDKLHLMQILHDVKMATKCGNYENLFFSKDTRAPQRDHAKAIEFAFTYPLETTIANSTPSLEKHNIVQSNYPIVPQNYQIDLDQQYANYISKILSYRNML